MAKHHPSPNDQRSNAKNPNNAANKASMDNRSVQLNTNQPQEQPPNPPSSKSKDSQTIKKE